MALISFFFLQILRFNSNVRVSASLLIAMVAPLFFSIVIPTRNRIAHLQVCLDSLADLDFPRDRFEAIVIDDGGLEPVAPVVERYGSAFRVQSLRQEPAGPAAARNCGAKAAAGEILVFTDDDCTLDPAYLRVLDSKASGNTACGIGGRTVNALTDNIYAAASACLIDFLYGYYNRDPENARFLTSNNMVLPLAGFLELGGFDESFRLAGGEDRDLCAR